jgi:hypothetical protein
LPLLPQLDDEFFRDTQVRVRRQVALLEKFIAQKEWFIKELADMYPPMEIARRQQEVGGLRIDLDKWKKVQKELERWEQERMEKPGIETDRAGFERYMKLREELWPPRQLAPPPREKK